MESCEKGTLLFIKLNIKNWVVKIIFTKNELLKIEMHQNYTEKWHDKKFLILYKKIGECCERINIPS
jgi:hypothetical protein